MTYRIMSRIRSKDTQPELLVRRRLWAAGYRYRLHLKALVGRPDIVFVGPKITVFVDGDFWHGNAWRVREKNSLADLFPTNTDWWVAKIERNMERDREVSSALEERGWEVIRVWESDILADLDQVVALITEAVDRRRGEMRR